MHVIHQSWARHVYGRGTFESWSLKQSSDTEKRVQVHYRHCGAVLQVKVVF